MHPIIFSLEVVCLIVHFSVTWMWHARAQNTHRWPQYLQISAGVDRFLQKFNLRTCRPTDLLHKSWIAGARGNVGFFFATLALEFYKRKGEGPKGDRFLYTRPVEYDKETVPCWLINVFFAFERKTWKLILSSTYILDSVVLV